MPIIIYMKIKKILIWFLLILVISNLPIINPILNLAIDENHYRFSNGDGNITWKDDIFKSNPDYKNFDSTSKVMLKVYKERASKDADTNFYRLFWKNPFCFWRWSSYFTDERYKLPYKNWQEIRNRRGYDLNHQTQSQQF